MKKTVSKKVTFGIALLLSAICLNKAFSQEIVSLYNGAIPNVANPVPEDRLIDAPWGKIYFQIADPAIEIYFPQKEKNTGIAVIICPGGAYSALAYGLEGVEPAKRFAENGITGIVLKYRLPDSAFYFDKEIVPLQDAQRALIIVRENASKWGIDADKIGIMGSSAGGHLASTTGTHFDKCYAPNPNNISVRPDFMVLNYPVISFADSLTHYGSRLKLIGESPIPEETLKLMSTDSGNAEKIMSGLPVPKEKIIEFSNELHVTAETPPTFIIHSNDDQTVKIQNSILFIAALQQSGVDVDCFFYSKGGHGFGIDNPTSGTDWIDSCIEWIKKLDK